MKHRGVVKLFTDTAQGKRTSSKADWGFISPIKSNRKGVLGDIHFTLFALQNIPHQAVKKDLVVEYTVIPGTNSARTVNAVTYDTRRATSDSGAWVHATPRKEDLVNFRTLETPIPVGTAKDNAIIFLTGIGDLCVRHHNEVTVFKHVFYGPEVSSTLLSVKLLTKGGGWSLYVDDKETTLTNKKSERRINLDENFQFSYTPEKLAALPYRQNKPMTAEEVAELPGMKFMRQGVQVTEINLLRDSTRLPTTERGNRSNDLVGYMNQGLMEFRPMELKDETSLCKWHRRLGHISVNYVKKFALQHDIKLSGKLGPMVCETCALNKIVRSISRKPRERAEKFRDRVHADLVGPFTPISRDGYKYAVVMVDCNSRDLYIYYQKTKQASETHKSFEAYCTEVGGNPKEIQADGGKEFQGICKTWCDEKRIKLSSSPLYAHHLNGVVERKIRTLKEMTRCMLNYAQLPAVFWTDAMRVSQYLIMRMPTSALPDWKSPYHIIHKKPPKYEHIKVFGAKVIYKKGDKATDENDTSNALADKEKEGVLIGFEDQYPTGTYKIWDTNTHQVVYSNTVTVFEEQNIKDTAAKDFFSDESREYEEFDTEDDYDPERDPGYATDDMEYDEGEDDQDMRHMALDESVRATNIVTGKRSRKQTKRYNPEYEATRAQWASAEQLIPLAMLSMMKPDPENRNDTTADEPNLNLFLLQGILKGEQMVPEIPKSDAAALDHPTDGKRWREARSKELNQFDKFQAYTEIDRSDVPIGKQILPTHFIRTIKRCGKFKYRLVAGGNYQLGDACYAPTAAITSLRMVIAMCNQRHYRIRQADVSAAYLQSPVDDEVYVERPPDPSMPNKERRRRVWRLKKAMYGLRKSPRYWHETVQNAMSEFGLHQSDTDPCVFTNKDLFVGVWVDDFIYGGTPEMREKFEAFLAQKFTLDAPEDVNNFCGIDIDQNGDTVTLRQDRYIQKIMTQFEIEPKDVRAPLAAYLPPADGQIDKLIPYRELVGALMFIMISTRPDIAFAIHHLSRFGTCYDNRHYKAAVRVLQYIHHTNDFHKRSIANPTRLF